ncbi:uncharacterized protein [Temnothorax longispinosus]|uniref:uncharacterized protein n=1 Tax=Temnothorax longispinosus TaxID=300112 RepID=UPI003A9A3230
MNHCHPSSHHGGSLAEKNSQACKLTILRWYNQGNTSQTTWSTSSVEFHGFSDTSQLAMAAVVSITVHGSNGATISLVCSKTKVAPLKARLTIPRLELTAALLLSRLMPYVQATLKLNVTATHLWTDSVVTLMWIKSHASRWKDFVRNRVSQIQELTANAHWKYVPAASQPDYHWDLIYKFIALLRGFWDGSLDSHSALEKARFFWIKATQAAYFTHEIKMLTANSRLPTAHAFSRLTAYIDAQEIIRVGGRLNQSALAQDNKHQAILPCHSRFSTLIIAHAHLRTLHGGTQLTLAHVRQNYWIIGGRAPTPRLRKCSSRVPKNINESLKFYNEIAPDGSSTHQALHTSGKWEAVVKSVKFHLRRTIGETLLTTEELTTLLTQIEASFNSRPLEPLSDDPEDVSALTPGHFLIGGPITIIPEPSLIDLATSRLSRWQLIQQRVQHF